MNTKQAAEKWNISERRVRVLCTEGRIPGAFHIGRAWVIPEESCKPVDERLAEVKKQADISSSDVCTAYKSAGEPNIADRSRALMSTFRNRVGIIAGPCAVENEEQIMTAAQLVRASGADMLRGGAYKPRTSPYTFQGLGREGLRLLRQAGDSVMLPVVTEALDVRDVEYISRFADIIQVGARNMQNVPLLVEIAESGKPVILKRGINATVEEFMFAAEYITSNGNPNVILCERGIRTASDTYTRNTLDLSAVAVLKRLTNLPVIVDPSHGTGRRELIDSMSLASIMAGADGLLIEMHPRPEAALSDAQQQVNGPELMKIVKNIRRTAQFRESLK